MFDYCAQPVTGADGRPPAKPREAVKFVVVDPPTGSRSATWSVFTGRKRDDVYLLEVTTGDTWKTSHHNEGGIWRIAMTSESAVASGSERAVLREWPRTPPKDGWSDGVAVLFPCAYLRPDRSEIAPEVIRVPTLPRHSAIAVKLMFGEAGTTSYTRVDDAFGVGVLLRPGRGTVYVVAQAVGLRGWQFESLAEMCRSVRDERPPDAPGDGRFVGVLLAEEQQFLSTSPSPDPGVHRRAPLVGSTQRDRAAASARRPSPSAVETGGDGRARSGGPALSLARDD